MVQKVWEVKKKLWRDARPDGKFCAGRDPGPPLSLALTHPPAPWKALSSSPFFSQWLCVQTLCYLPFRRPFAAQP